MSAKESLLRFGVEPEKAEEIVHTCDCDRLNCWLCNTPILVVINDMISKGWLHVK